MPGVLRKSTAFGAAVPVVRIHLPPAESQTNSNPNRLRGKGMNPSRFGILTLGSDCDPGQSTPARHCRSPVAGGVCSAKEIGVFLGRHHADEATEAQPAL